MTVPSVPTGWDSVEIESATVEVAWADGSGNNAAPATEQRYTWSALDGFPVPASDQGMEDALVSFFEDVADVLAAHVAPFDPGGGAVLSKKVSIGYKAIKYVAGTYQSL